MLIFVGVIEARTCVAASLKEISQLPWLQVLKKVGVNFEVETTVQLILQFCISQKNPLAFLFDLQFVHT